MATEFYKQQIRIYQQVTAYNRCALDEQLLIPWCLSYLANLANLENLGQVEIANL